MNVQRGEVVLIDYPYAVGSGTKVRPAVVIQNDHDNQRLPTTIIAQITGTTHRATLEATQFLIDIGTADGQLSGLHRSSVVNCANLFTIDRQDVLRRIGMLSPVFMQQLDLSLKAAMSLS